jgi:maltose alpha-D-glucosyltransferase / alpha-amylase
MRAMSTIPAVSQNQMLNFLRHHDELTLKLLKKKEVRRIFERFAPDENMQIYVTGIRRRLGPMLSNDRKLLELAYSMMFSLPGVPLIRFGEELGMGDNLALEGRNSVRTPMQWSDDRNAGFTTNDRHTPRHPVIKDGPYGYRKVNLCKAQREQSSLLNWLQRLIVIRKRCPQIGLGKLKVIPAEHPGVLLHTLQWNGDLLLFMHNFSAKPARIAKADIGPPNMKWIPLFCARSCSTNGDAIRLEGYDYKWLRADGQE